MLHRVLISLLVILCLSFPSIESVAQEVIKSFHSEIEVNNDGSLVVTEFITVNSEGRNIRRGIFRDFPFRYYSFLEYIRR